MTRTAVSSDQAPDALGPMARRRLASMAAAARERGRKSFANVPKATYRVRQESILSYGLIGVRRGAAVVLRTANRAGEKIDAVIQMGFESP